MKTKIKAGIIGAAGYTGGELIRLLVNHPNIELTMLNSESNAGKKVYEVHKDLFGSTELYFTDELHTNMDVVFLCKGHGESKLILEQNKLPDNVKIIDLSQDFRHKENSNGFIYGLPELNKEKIVSANKIANPGCFATAIELALLPLAKNNMLNETIHASATTGSTGAGQSHSYYTHFSHRNQNHNAYKTLEHQHLKEITESLSALQNNFDKEILLVPQRGSFSRGIYAITYLTTTKSLEECQNLYSEFYKNAAFTKLVPFPIDVKTVTNTNKCFIYMEKVNNQLIIHSVIDNLLKGASGQAVQNMNIMFGLNETEGLNLKANAF